MNDVAPINRCACMPVAIDFDPERVDPENCCPAAQRLRDRVAAIVRAKDADLDDSRDERDYLTEEVRRWRSAVEAVRALHLPESCITGGGTDWRCAECKNTPLTASDIGWPCPTMRAITTVLAS